MQPVLQFVHPQNVHITPVLKQLHWLPVKTRISYKIVCLCFNAINYYSVYFCFLISCSCTLPLDLFAPVLTPAS